MSALTAVEMASKLIRLGADMRTMRHFDEATIIKAIEKVNFERVRVMADSKYPEVGKTLKALQMHDEGLLQLTPEQVADLKQYWQDYMKYKGDLVVELKDIQKYPEWIRPYVSKLNKQGKAREYQGQILRFPPEWSDVQVNDFMFKLERKKHREGVADIELPSEVTPERQAAIDEALKPMINPDKADVLPFPKSRQGKPQYTRDEIFDRLMELIDERDAKYPPTGEIDEFGRKMSPPSPLDEEIQSLFELAGFHKRGSEPNPKLIDGIDWSAVRDWMDERRPDIWDAENGMGNIPLTNPREFQGFVRWMEPEQFLRHTPELERERKYLTTDTNAHDLQMGLAQRKKFSPPVLWARWSEEGKVWVVSSHEGRHRAAIVQQMRGESAQMPVHILPQDKNGYYMKKHQLTEEQRKAPIVGIGAAGGAAVVTGKQPQKLEPGVYLDEDSGKYFKLDNTGNLQEIHE
jgi:hypothetical protein